LAVVVGDVPALAVAAGLNAYRSSDESAGAVDAPFEA
jgi:hypothetical protein